MNIFNSFFFTFRLAVEVYRAACTGGPLAAMTSRCRPAEVPGFFFRRRSVRNRDSCGRRADSDDPQSTPGTWRRECHREARRRSASTLHPSPPRQPARRENLLTTAGHRHHRYHQQTRYDWSRVKIVPVLSETREITVIMNHIISLLVKYKWN